jgi:hypothetical protein
LKLFALLSLAGLTILGACSGQSNTLTGLSSRPDTTNVQAGSGTVTDTTTHATPAAECSAPKAAWIWCDDFEQDRLSRYFEYVDAGGRFTRTPGVGYNGSTGMQARWLTGLQDAGALHLAIGKTPQAAFRPVDGGTAVYQEIFWRLYLKNQEGWVGAGGDKLTRAFSFASGTSYAQAAFGHVWSGNSTDPTTNNYLMVDPASGTDVNGNLTTTTYNDFSNMRWLTSAVGRTPIFDVAHVGKWHCVEVHMRLNSSGQSDGVLELWVDGAMEAQRTGLNYVGSAPYGINAVYFENYWNAGAPTNEERYLDNIVVSTARVGCL